MTNSTQTTISTTTQKIINELNQNQNQSSTSSSLTIPSKRNHTTTTTTNQQPSQTIPSSPPCSSTSSSIRNTSDPLSFNHHHHQFIKSSIPINSHPSLPSILSNSNHQGSRTFSDKHHAQIMEILASIPNQSTSEEINSTKEKQSVTRFEDAFHPTLRSTQSPHVSSPPSTTQHLHPTLLSSVSSDHPLTMNPIISNDHPSSSKPLAQRSPWSSSIHDHCSNEREEPVAGASHTHWNPPRSRSSSPSHQEPRPEKNPLPSTDPIHQDDLESKIDKRLAEASTLVWNDHGIGNEGSDACTNGNTNGESVDRNSVQWKQNRKNNHKEVERRRRETINEGITELKKIVPGSEKNKGEILKQAVKYIQELKETERRIEERWAAEKVVMEEVLQEKSHQIEKLSRDYLGLESENESLKRWIIELGEKSQIQVPRIRVQEGEREDHHDHERRMLSRTSSSEPTRNDQPIDSVPDQSHQPRSYPHDSQTQDHESNIHHLLRTATEEIRSKRSNNDLSNDPPNSLKKHKLI